jgi:GNAT superfamily N-acetyltransferase
MPIKTFKQHILDHPLEGLNYIKHSIVDGRDVYTVYDQKNKIATAMMSGQGHYVSDLDVVPHMRRMGVATALYNHIEKVTGQKLIPSPMYQTDQGKAFWASRKESD